MLRFLTAAFYAGLVAALIAGSYHTYRVHEPAWRRPAAWIWCLWVGGPVLLGWAVWAGHLGPRRAGAAVGGIAAYNVPGLLPCDGSIHFVPLFGVCAGAFVGWCLKRAPPPEDCVGHTSPGPTTASPDRRSVAGPEG